MRLAVSGVEGFLPPPLAYACKIIFIIIIIFYIYEPIDDQAEIWSQQCIFMGHKKKLSHWVNIWKHFIEREKTWLLN